MVLDFSVIWDNWWFLMVGVKNTLIIGIIALFFSFIIGIGLAFMTQGKNKILSFLAVSYIEFFRNTPFLAQLFFWYFGLSSIGLDLSPMMTSVIALSLCAAAINSEVIRSGIISISIGIVEASQALGLNRWQIARCVVFPIALQVAFKPLASNFINLILTTSTAMAITANELMSRIATLQADHEPRTLEIYATALILFGSITTILSIATKLIDYYLISKDYQKKKAMSSLKFPLSTSTTNTSTTGGL